MRASLAAGCHGSIRGFTAYLSTFPSSWPPSICDLALSASSLSANSTYANPRGRFTTCKVIGIEVLTSFSCEAWLFGNAWLMMKVHRLLQQYSSDNKRKRCIMPLRVYLHICIITGVCFAALVCHAIAASVLADCILY